MTYLKKRYIKYRNGTKSWCHIFFNAISLRIFFFLFQDPVFTTKDSSYFLCRSNCLDNSPCEWVSYSSANDDTCLLFTECPEKTDDNAWVSSQKECNDYQCYLPNVQCIVCLFIILCQTNSYLAFFFENNTL